MADLTITLEGARAAAVDSEAEKEGLTVAQVAQAAADQQADILRNDQVNAWWNSKTLEQKEAIKNS